MSAQATTHKRHMRISTREAIYAYIMIAPWIVGFIIFTLGPMIASLIFSFTDYSITKETHFLGIANFVEMTSKDPRFWISLRVTLTYAVIAIPVGLVVGLLLALLLNQNVPAITVWRTLFYTPSVVSGVAVAVLWSYVFNPRFGIMNWLLSLIAIKGPGWLSSPTWSLPAHYHESVGRGWWDDYLPGRFAGNSNRIV
jgi:multiple sugar transport system permease protein